jgi:hypothetical protein
MRCNQRPGNGLRINCRSSQSTIWQNQRHIGPHACVRNRTATTAKCFEPLRLEHSDYRRPQHCALERPRTNNSSDFPGHNSDNLRALTRKTAGKPGISIEKVAAFGRFLRRSPRPIRRARRRRHWSARRLPEMAYVDSTQLPPAILRLRDSA